MKRPVQILLADRKLRTEGQRRGTKYFAGGRGGTARKRKATKRKAGKKKASRKKAKRKGATRGKKKARRTAYVPRFVRS